MPESHPLAPIHLQGPAGVDDARVVMNMGEYFGGGVVLLILGPIVFFVVAQIIVGASLMAINAGKRRRPFPSCGGCGYDLTGSLGTAASCPECGASLEVAGIRPIDDGKTLAAFVMGALMVFGGLLLAGLWGLTYSL